MYGQIKLILTFCGFFLERFGDGDTSQIGLDLDEVTSVQPCPDLCTVVFRVSLLAPVIIFILGAICSFSLCHLQLMLVLTNLVVVLFVSLINLFLLFFLKLLTNRNCS